MQMQEYHNEPHGTGSKKKGTKMELTLYTQSYIPRSKAQRDCLYKIGLNLMSLMPQFSAHLPITCQQQHQEITKDDGVVAVEDVAAACASDGAERLGARELEVSEVASLQEPQPSDTCRPGARGNAQQRRRGRSWGFLRRRGGRGDGGLLLLGRRLRAAPEARGSLREDGQHENG